MYDALYLNRGIKVTFFSVSTPFAFLERITKEGGLKDLGEVLSKWNEGTHVAAVLAECRLCRWMQVSN